MPPNPGTIYVELLHENGVSHEQVAEALGIQLPWAYDLGIDGDLQNTISLKQFYTLCDLLHVTPRDFFPTLIDHDSPLAVTQFISLLRDKIARHWEGVHEVENSAGWQVAEALENPEVLLNTWCIDQLLDICTVSATPFDTLQGLFLSSRPA